MKVLITGAGGGFGKLIVKKLSAEGHSVVGSMRDPNGRNASVRAELEAQGATIVEIDVTDDASVATGVDVAKERLGQIDVLINNAGLGVIGIQESFTAEDLRRLFDINVLGVQRMARAVLPDMRARRSGLLVQTSSLLGRVTMPFYGPYNATKWALEALSENYRTELSGFGIEVCIVEPGGFPTTFMDNVVRPSDKARTQGYGEMAGAPEASLHHFGQFLATQPQQNPQLVADAVAAVVAGAPGKRPFRTVVDRIGMGDAIKPYNDLLASVTAGIYGNLGMAEMLIPKVSV